MLPFSDFLVESQEINLAMKAYKTLSYSARDAIERWQISGWHEGRLTNAFRHNDELAQEIIAAFAPVREYMKRKHGETIKLYRGLRLDPYSYKAPTNKVLESWTSHEKTAMYFAGLPREELPTITNKQIKDAVKQYNRTGFVKFRHLKYIRDKNNPGYYQIYQGREHITDGDDLERSLRDDQQWLRQRTKEIRAGGKVITRMVPIDDIVWITNRLDCKEFICRRQN